MPVSLKDDRRRPRSKSTGGGRIGATVRVGAESRSPHASGQHNRRVFDSLLSGFRVLPFDAAAGRLYGPIRAHLEKHGRLIGPYDLMIAAHAQSLDAVLVTDDTKESDRVAGLKTENWLTPG